MKYLLGVASVAIFLAASPSVAQTQPQAQPQPSTQTASNTTIAADQVICEKQEDTGSRLSSHKICHTRSQWEQLRHDDRSNLERAQEQRGMIPH